MSKQRERVIFVAKLVMSLVLLAVIIAGVGVTPLVAAMQSVPPNDWIAALGYLWLAYVVACVRWWRWVRVAGQAVPWAEASSSYARALFFNMVLPTGVGGDVVRTVELARGGYDFGALLATAIVDRIVGLAAAVIMALIAMLLLPEALPTLSFTAWTTLWLLTAILVASYVLYPYCESWILTRLATGTHAAAVMLNSVGQHFRQCRAQHSALGAALLLSLMAHGFITLAYVELARGLGVTLPLSYFLLIVPLVFMAQTLPIALGGLGLREAALVVLLLDSGVSREVATALSVVFLAVMWLSVLPSGLWAVSDWLRKKDRRDE